MIKMTKKEALFAEKILCNSSYVFPCNAILLKNGQKYRPDFYIPIDKKFIEVIGSNHCFFRNKHKFSILREMGEKLEIWDYRGFLFNENIQQNGMYKTSTNESIKVYSSTYSKLLKLKESTGISIKRLVDNAVKKL